MLLGCAIVSHQFLAYDASTKQKGKVRLLCGYKNPSFNSVDMASIVFSFVGLTRVCVSQRLGMCASGPARVWGTDNEFGLLHTYVARCHSSPLCLLYFVARARRTR